LQYNLNVKSQEDLKEGQKYIGKTYRVRDKNGNIIEDYRADGSIMFSNEASGYSRIWNNTQKTGNEEMGIIMDKGVLVLPSWDNEINEAKYTKYRYKFEKGSLIDPVLERAFNIVATVHTHPSGGDMSIDGGFARVNTPLKPMFAISVWGENIGDISYIMHSGTWGNYSHRSITSSNSNINAYKLLNATLSLRTLSNKIINHHMKTGTFILYPSIKF
jgi:hypothetical protein